LAGNRPEISELEHLFDYRTAIEDLSRPNISLQIGDISRDFSGLGLFGCDATGHEVID
jgi:hypothetical protein